MRDPAPSFDEIAKTPWALGKLHKGDLQGALNSFAVRFLLNYRQHFRIHSDNDLCGFGVVLWLMGDRLGAANLWAKVCDDAYRGRITHSSHGCFQAPLLLWFASVWLKDEDWQSDAKQTFDKLLKRRRPVMGADFSSKLARLLRKETTLTEIKAEPTRNLKNAFPGIRATLDPEHEIMAIFYAGVRAYEEDDLKTAKEIWRQVSDPGRDGPLEYYLLLHEREKLSNKRGRP